MPAPLYTAVLNGNKVECEKILNAIKEPEERKNAIEIRDEEGMTPLHIAVSNGNTEIMDLLISNDADVVAETKKKETPLHLAVLNQKLNAVSFLLEHFAEIKLTMFENENENENENDVMRPGYLNPIECINDQGLTSLHLAVYFDNLDIIKRLVYHGANINAITNNSFFCSPLFIAAQKNHFSAVNFLLQQESVEINLGNANNATPLYVAAENGFNNILDLLLNNGADPEIKNRLSCTALMIASQEGHKSCVRLLLEHGADVNISDSINRTPLMFAIANKKFSIVKLLLKYCADTEITFKCENKEYTAKTLATFMKVEDILNLLHTHEQNQAKLKANSDAKIHKLVKKIETLESKNEDPLTKAKLQYTQGKFFFFSNYPVVASKLLQASSRKFDNLQLQDRDDKIKQRKEKIKKYTTIRLNNNNG